MKNDLITELEHNVRAEQKWRDGIPQIAVGLFLIIAMELMIGNKGNLFVVFIPIIPILIEGLRKRFTYPRVGRAVLYEKFPKRAVLIIVIASVLLLGLMVGIITRFQRPILDTNDRAITWSLLIIPLLLTATIVYRSRVEHNSRILWYAAFIILLSLAILIFRLHRLTVEYIVMGFGILNVIYGIVALMVFIHRYPVVSDEQ